MSHPSASIDINAPIEVVWSVMLDAERYGEWNPFVVRVETAQPAQVGNPITLHVRWANGKGAVSPERITAIEPPSDGQALLAYVYEGWPSKLGLVRGLREQRLTEIAGGTRYDTVEFFSGPLVALAGPARVADGFRRHAEGLKARAESLRPGPG